MINSKLVELYKTLTSVEKRRFREYVESPFFNSNSLVVKLNRYIAAALEANNRNKLVKEEVFVHLFGKGKYDKQKVSTIMTFLMDHLENFIAHLEIEKNKFLQKVYLLAELRERNLGKHFISNTNEYINELEEKKTRDSEYFYERYVLERELDHFFMKGEVRKSNESLQRKSDSLDTFYLSEKLKSLCEMMNRKNIIAGDYNITMLNELRTYLDANIKYFKTIPAVYIYYCILLTMLETDDSLHYKELKQSLNTYSKAFSKEEALQMYLNVQNYCIKKINGGKLEYLEELFSNYETLLASELIFEENYLSQWDYKNIVAVSIRLNKFDWTKEFIEKYKNRIAAEFRENAYEYNLAVCYYSNKDYKSALKLLQHVEFTDVFYHLGAKSMLLKIYYELDEVEPFYSLIDAYKVYLVRNKKISVFQRQGHEHLVKYAKQAFNIKLRGVSAGAAYTNAVKKLKSRINTNKNDANLTWLQERVEEL